MPVLCAHPRVPQVLCRCLWDCEDLQCLLEEDCTWVIGVSLSGSAWECTPPQLDGQCPRVDMGGSCCKVGQTLQRSSALELPKEQVGFLSKPHLYSAYFPGLSHPVPFTGLTIEHPLPKSHTHLSSSAFMELKREAEVGHKPRST